jgi:hypothetical protein
MSISLPMCSSMMHAYHVQHLQPLSSHCPTTCTMHIVYRPLQCGELAIPAGMHMLRCTSPRHPQPGHLMTAHLAARQHTAALPEMCATGDAKATRTLQGATASISTTCAGYTGARAMPSRLADNCILEPSTSWVQARLARSCTQAAVQGGRSCGTA